jgi:hypothetical protein
VVKKRAKKAPQKRGANKLKACYKNSQTIPKISGLPIIK